LFGEEVFSLLACLTDPLKLLSHELSFIVADTFAEGAFNVDGKAFGTLDLGFHCCGTGGLFT